MRRGEVPIDFDCTSAAFSASRVGFPVTFSDQVDDFDPPDKQEDARRQYSRRHTRKATTVHGTYHRGRINYPLIAGDRFPLIEELVESIKGETPYTIRADNLPGVMRSITAFSKASEVNVDRVKSCDLYSLNIRFESLDQAPKPSAAATELTFGNVVTNVPGTSGANVVRFAHFFFAVSATPRTLTCTLVGADLRVSVNGHRLITQVSGTQTHTAIAIETSMLVSNGINIIRVEAWNATNDWSITNLKVD